MPDKTAEIALVISELASRGGAQRVATILANALAARGRSVTVVTLDQARADAFGLTTSVERVGLELFGDSRSPLGAAFANLHRVRALRRCLKRIAPEVVMAFVGTTNILAVLAAMGLGTRLVICERNDPARQSLGRPWDWLRRLLYRRADLVTANSRAALASMASYVPCEKLQCLPNPLCLPDAVEPAVVEGPTVLAVGRLDPQKGYDVLIDGFARSAACDRGYRLGIVGEGPLGPVLRSQVAELGLGERVDWYGWRDDPFAFYAASTMLVLASRHEGMPNVVLEALGSGLPVIVSDACPGALEFVEHEVSGLVFPAGDRTRLAGAIDRLAGDSDLRERLADAGRARVRDCHPDRALVQWEAVLEGHPAAGCAAAEAMG